MSEYRSIYRNRTKAAVFVVCGIYGAAMTVALALLARPTGVDALEIALGFGLSVWCIARVSRCGVYAEGDGIRVVNPLSSTRLRWEEISRFVLPERGSALVERVHGSAVKAFGLQPTTWAQLRGSTQRSPEAGMVDELNRRLSAR